MKEGNVRLLIYAFLSDQFGQNWHLHQDNDPKHTSHICRKSIDENVPALLGWPSNSPGVNSIENIWAIVKRNVEKKKKLVNIDELERFLAEEFQNIVCKELRVVYEKQTSVFY